MTELAKKLPAIIAIVILGILGVELLRRDIDSFLIGLVLVGVSGLGGFGLQEFLRKRLGP